MKHTFLKTLLSAAVLGAMSNGAFAAGTTAGLSIDNSATISYNVGTVAQTPIKSSPTGNSTPGTALTDGAPTTFVVDKKIDLTVTPPASTTQVTPNTPSTTPNNLVFKVTNTGNSAENFTMSVLETVGGDFDTAGCTITPSTITSLAVDTDTDVTVSCAIPNSGATNNGGVAGAGVVGNSKTSIVALVAEVTGVINDTGTDDPATMQTVFADGDGVDDNLRDAKSSARGTYIISAADLKVTKTSAVISDPSNGTTNPKRIPGAVIEYTITVENPAGGANATGIVINDTLEGKLTFVSCLESGDGITGCSNTGNAVTTPAFTLTGGQTATLKIKATVK